MTHPLAIRRSDEGSLAARPSATPAPRRTRRRNRILAWLHRDTFVATAIILIASSLSPFALANAGVFPERLFYLALMPFLVLGVVLAPSIRVNPHIALVIGSQVLIIFVVYLFDGGDGHLKTIGTLLSILLVSLLFSSRLLDIRVFVHVATVLTIGVLLLAAVSSCLAYLGYVVPVPRFNRGGDGDIVYQVGYTLTNTVYPAGGGVFIRPSGVFVEAGQLAMYASLAMMANATVLRNRAYELLLTLLGLFTTALAFYLFLPAFFILFGRRRALSVYAAAFALAVLVTGGPALIREDVVLDHVLGRQISFFSETFGGNRAASTASVASNLDKLRALGSVKDDAFKGLDADASIFGPFLTYGLFGGLFAYLHVLLFAAVPAIAWIRRANRPPVHTRMPAIFALLALNLFQRPFTLHFLYYVYLVAMFEWECRKYRPAGDAQPRLAAG